MSFLGITLKCARCHDHKFDPISQQDYYRFRAIFEPHGFRVDRLPGKIELGPLKPLLGNDIGGFERKEGLARACDAKLDAQTFVYERGDPSQIDESQTILPGVPPVLGAQEFRMQTVELPRLAYYPNLSPFVERDLVKNAQIKVEQARTQLDTANRELAAVKPQISQQESAPDHAELPIAKKEAAVELAEMNLGHVEAQLLALQARYAAERGKYADAETDSAMVARLARSASEAEKRAVLHQSELNVARAVHELALARLAVEQAAREIENEHHRRGKEIA